MTDTCPDVPDYRADVLPGDDGGDVPWRSGDWEDPYGDLDG